MIKKLSYIILATLCLAACRTIDLPMNGYLVIDGINLGNIPQVTVGTRSVDADLNIEILDSNNEAVKSFIAGSAEAGQKIELEPDTYTLHAYTGNITEKYDGNDLGAPKYSGSVTFTIQEEKTSYITLSVPMVNTGISLLLPENFDTYFNHYTFTVTFNDRTVTFDNTQTAYFDMPETSADATCILSATNTDEEVMSSTKTFQPESGKVFTITYSL